MSHVTHMHESYHTQEWVMSHICMSHVTHMHESWHTYERVSHVEISHVTHLNKLCHTYECVMSHTWMSLVSHVNDACHERVTHICVMSHTKRGGDSAQIDARAKWMSHFTHKYKSVVSHTKEEAEVRMYEFVTLCMSACMYEFVTHTKEEAAVRKSRLAPTNVKNGRKIMGAATCSACACGCVCMSSCMYEFVNHIYIHDMTHSLIRKWRVAPVHAIVCAWVRVCMSPCMCEFVTNIYVRNDSCVSDEQHLCMRLCMYESMYVWVRDSYIYMTWLIRSFVSDVQRLCMRSCMYESMYLWVRDSYIYMTWLMHRCDMTH